MPLWTCPRCGASFTRANQWHSCGRFELDPLFAKSAPVVRRLYDRFAELATGLGPVTVLPQKSRVAFQARMRFAAVTPQRSCLKGHLVLSRPVESPCFERVDSLSPRNHVHVFRLDAEDQLSPEFAAWVGEAYEVGCQAHLGSSRKLVRASRARRAPHRSRRN
jgi:hypothetical protein